MKYLKDIIVGILFVYIFLIPAWIVGVSRSSLPVKGKKVIIIMLVLTSVIFTVVGMIKPNPDFTTRIIGSIVIILYLILTVVAACQLWPK